MYDGRDAKNRGCGWNQRHGRARYRGRRSSSQRGYSSSQKADNSSQRRRKNPLDEHGEVCCYNVCGLTFHWANKCPDAFDYQEYVQVVETTKNETPQRVIPGVPKKATRLFQNNKKQSTDKSGFTIFELLILEVTGAISLKHKH